MYLRVAFLHHIPAANVCEKFVNCERIFCINPVADSFFKTHGVINCSSCWEKDIVNQCLEFACASIHRAQTAFCEV